MANADDLRRIALSLEGTEEAPHFDRASFRVARIYCTLAPDKQTANLNLTPDQQLMKMETHPEAFQPVPNSFGTKGWTTIILPELTQADLTDALTLAWGNAQPRRKKG